MVSVWNGRTADALRESMRMSVADFASLLEVSERAAAQWRAQGSAVRLRWDVQQRLDRILATADPAVLARFEAAVSAMASPAAAMFVAVKPTVQLGLIRMEQAVGRVRRAYQEARSRDALADIPVLLGQPLPPRLLSGVYHVASDLCAQLGDLRLATYAAQRCQEEAEASGDPLIVAASAWAISKVLRRSGKRKAAAKLARAAAEKVNSWQATPSVGRDVTPDGPRGLSARGALLLEAAVAASDLVLVDEAAESAKKIGDGRSFGWTSFGPSNVELHRAEILTTLGQPQAALDTDVDWKTLPAERKAHYFSERARAWDALGDPARALDARKQAQLLAPGLLKG